MRPDIRTQKIFPRPRNRAIGNLDRMERNRTDEEIDVRSARRVWWLKVFMYGLIVVGLVITGFALGVEWAINAGVGCSTNDNGTVKGAEVQP